jgi:hypothetical protein
MYTIKNTTGGCGAKGASGAGIAPPGNPGEVLYLVSSGVAGAAADVLYKGSGNLYASNSVTTANVFVTDTLNVDGSMTANAANATFFFDTFTIPYINTQVINVATSMTLSGNLSAPLANITTLNVNYLTVNSAVVYGTSTLNVYGVSNLSTTTVNGSMNVTGPLATLANLYASNAVTTANVFSTNVYASKYVGIGNSTPPQPLTITCTNTGPIATDPTGITLKNGNVDVLLGTNASTNTGQIQVTSGGTSSTSGATPYSLFLNPRGGTVAVNYTANPAANLYVAGSVSIGAAGYAGVNQTNGLLVSGNVGIGTASPSATLDIRGGSISLGSFDTSSAARYVGLYNVNESGGPLVGMEIENTTLTGNYSQKLHLRTHWFGNNNGRRLTIDEYGNVFTTKNLTTNNPYWFITHSVGGNATYNSTSGAWFSSTANGTIYGNYIAVGGTASASAFNTTTGTFTFPAAGTYTISVPMFINGATGGRYAIAIFGSSIKPGSQYFEFTSNNLASNEMRTWTYVKQVNAGDTMYLSTPAGSITLYLAEVHTTLNIFKIG